MGRAIPFVALVAACTLLLGLAACGDGDDPAEVTPTAVAERSPTSAASLIPRRTGIPEVDTVLDAVEAGDVERISALLRFTAMPCGSAGGLVVCDPGEGEGASRDMLALAACEEALLSRDEVESSWLPGWSVNPTVYGVYTAPPSSGQPLDPPAEYIAVFAAPESTRGLFATAIDQGRIVKLFYGLPIPPNICAATPEVLVEGLGLEEAILPPLAP